MPQELNHRAGQTAAGHLPVMLAEALEGLAIEPDGRYLDACYGRGGHSRAILAALGPEGRLLAFDRDPQAVASGVELQQQDARFRIHQGNFADMERAVEASSCAGILFDFGVSSPQLDDAGRGFSFLRDGPLDMRMDPGSGPSAAEWLAAVAEDELARVLFEYGEERHARRIAAAIVRRRDEQPFERTVDLAGCIAAVLPRARDGAHPATRSFQALRIVVNGELDAIERGLEAAERLLAPRGRLVAISFHSLEDRRVKQFIQRRSRQPASSRRLPPAAARQLSLRDLGKRRPGTAELALNPRARSAVMRIAEKVAA